MEKRILEHVVKMLVENKLTELRIECRTALRIIANLEATQRTYCEDDCLAAIFPEVDNAE